MLQALLKTMRPRQWPKNIFLFAALVFDKQLLIFDAFVRTAAGFVLFCLISSAVYIFNDLADIEADREHPEKMNRPIPSGKLPISIAWMACIVLVIVALSLGYWLAPDFAIVLAGYFMLNLAYSKWLKHIPILDVLVLAAGFVLLPRIGMERSLFALVIGYAAVAFLVGPDAGFITGTDLLVDGGVVAAMSN